MIHQLMVLMTMIMTMIALVVMADERAGKFTLIIVKLNPMEIKHVLILKYKDTRGTSFV